MNIGFVHYSCPPVTGGVEEVIRRQAEALVRAGNRVYVLAGEGGPFLEGTHVDIEPDVGSNRPGVSEDAVYRILTDWAKGLDVVLAHNAFHMPFNLSLTGALHRLADSGTVKVVDWAHDSAHFQSTPVGGLDGPEWNILTRSNPMVIYVTISKARKAQFEKILPEADWRVITNGIDPSGVLRSTDESRLAIRELNLEGRFPVMVQPVRLVRHKNVECSVRIAAALKSQGRSPLLVVPTVFDVNDPDSVSYHGELLDLIKELGVENEVDILRRNQGESNRTLLWDLYRTADCLLMTSRDEGFGLVLLEAGLMKLPIVCSNIPPFLEVGRGNLAFGLDDPPGDIAQEIIHYLLAADPEIMFQRVMNVYSWDRILRDQLMPFLHSICARPAIKA